MKALYQTLTALSNYNVMDVPPNHFPRGEVFDPSLAHYGSMMVGEDRGGIRFENGR